ncbi:MAG: hypothetical protein GYB31_16850 [Bacteroidetes bacterium]|nr:hypothetical protein [Bacteroidota bacterium]
MKYPLTYQTFLLLLSCFVWTSTSAQWEDPESWQYYVDSENINEIVEQDGSLWMATNKGVVTWDKANQTGTYYYTHNSNLPFSHISSITRDVDGQIWIGTYDNMLAVFENGDWTTTEVPLPDNFSGNPQLFTLTIGPDNRKWIGTNYGLVIEDAGEWTIYTDQDVPEGFLFDIWEIDINPINGNAYIAGFEWMEFDGENWTNLSEDLIQMIFYGGADIAHTSDGAAWATNLFSGVGRYKDGQLTFYSTQDENSWYPEAPLGNFIKLFEWNDEIYLLTQTSGIYKFEDEVWVEQATPLLSQMEVYIEGLFIDEEDKEWAYINNELIFLEDMEVNRLAVSEFGLTTNVVRSFSQNSNGDLYIADGKSSIFTYQPDGSLLRLETPLDQLAFAPSIFKAEWNNFNEYWVATTVGLYKMEGGIWTLYHEDLGNFPSWTAQDFTFDENGQPWVVTPADIYRYDNGSGSWISVNDEMNLPELQFRFIHHTPDGAVWITEQFTDLVIRIADGTWQSFNYSNAPWMSDHYVTSLNSTEDGTLWAVVNFRFIHTYKDGVWEPEVIQPAEPYEPIVYHIHQYQDQILASTNLGFFIKEDGAWTQMTVDNSLLLDNYCLNSTVSGDGALWISNPTEGIMRMEGFGAVSSSTKAEVLSSSLLKVSPNPATNHIQVEVPAIMAQGQTQWTIIDRAGRTLKTGIWTLRGEKQREIRVSDLPVGWYAIRIQQDQHLISTVFLKQ